MNTDLSLQLMRQQRWKIKLLTPAGSHTDEPFQRSENSCLPQYPKVLLDVYKPILKNITESGCVCLRILLLSSSEKLD